MPPALGTFVAVSSPMDPTWPKHVRTGDLPRPMSMSYTTSQDPFKHYYYIYIYVHIIISHINNICMNDRNIFLILVALAKTSPSFPWNEF